MSDTPALEAAAIEAFAARERLSTTANALKARLDPPRLLDDAVESAKSGAANAAVAVVDAAQRKPRAAAGIVAAITLFLFRKPIARRLRRRRARRRETDMAARR